jgi:hypothetical protein
MNSDSNIVERVIGFDSHPDSFTAAVLRGPTPAAAITEKIFNKLAIGQLQAWAKKHTTDKDLIVLEASGNSFQVVRTLAAVGRKALVLESCHLGKLKEAHANNDKISAVRIAESVPGRHRQDGVGSGPAHSGATGLALCASQTRFQGVLT